jgi:phage gp29-like protein
MEDTWPRLKKNLNELKRAVQRVDMIPRAFVIDKKPSPLAEKKKDVLAAAIAAMQPRPEKDENGWEDGLYDVMDAVGKSISVQEILWDIRPSDGLIYPRAWQWIYPRHFGYFVNQPDLMLSISGVGSDYTEFPDNKFLISTFKTKSGHLLTSALLRSLATFWIGANFSYDWALNLAQMFGLPIRWATYDPSNPGLLSDISDMLENMGSAGWGAFPAGTTLELKEAVRDATQNPQTFLMNLADTAADLLILGQTLTSTQGERGSQSLGKVHQDVRAEVIAYVGAWVAQVLNYQFVPKLMLLNFGNNDEDPYFIADIEQQKDALTMAQRDLILLYQMRTPVAADWFYERHDIPMPGPDDELLEVPEPVAAPNPVNEENKTATSSRLTINAKAANATNKLIDNMLEGLTGMEAKWLGSVRPFFVDLYNMAKHDQVTDAELIATIEKAATVMPELFPKLQTEALAKDLEKGITAAIINGASGGLQSRRLTKSA